MPRTGKNPFYFYGQALRLSSPVYTPASESGGRCRCCVTTIKWFVAPPSTNPFKTLSEHAWTSIPWKEISACRMNSGSYWPWVCRRLCRARDDARRGSECQRRGMQNPRPCACSAFFRLPRPCLSERTRTGKMRNAEGGGFTRDSRQRQREHETIDAVQ